MHQAQTVTHATTCSLRVRRHVEVQRTETETTEPERSGAGNGAADYLGRSA